MSFRKKCREISVICREISREIIVIQGKVQGNQLGKSISKEISVIQEKV